MMREDRFFRIVTIVALTVFCLWLASLVIGVVVIITQ
jgi:hypothetical protein